MEELLVDGGNWFSQLSRARWWLCFLFQHPVLVVPDRVRILDCSDRSCSKGRGSQEQDRPGKPLARKGLLQPLDIYHYLNLLEVVCSSVAHPAEFY